MAQVEADETEGGVYIGALEGLAVEAIVLLAETHIDLVHLAAIEDDRVGVLGGVAVAGALLAGKEEERDAPYHGNEADHVLPDVVPRDDAAGGKEQQDADAAADNGTGLILVVEDVDEAGDDDEKRPPAFEADADDVEKFEGPYDAEGHKGDAPDDFACAFHCVREMF